MKIHIDNPDHTIVIEKCYGDNQGFILTEFSEWNDAPGEYQIKKSVFEQHEDADKHKEHVERLLWTVLEALEEWNSKHDPQRVNIEVEQNTDS